MHRPSWRSPTIPPIRSVWPACSMRPASAPVEDLGRGLRLSPVPEAGGRNLVLDLLPYGVAAIRVGAPRVQLSAVTPYPSEAVLTTMQSRFNELSAQLARLNHGLAATPAEPANPGFEPDQSPFAVTDPDSRQAVDLGAGHQGDERRTSVVPTGWRLEANVAGSTTIAIDGENPHPGQGSLRLTAPAAPASVVSETFVPNVQSSLDDPGFLPRVRGWLPRFASGSKGNPADSRTSGARS